MLRHFQFFGTNASSIIWGRRAWVKPTHYTLGWEAEYLMCFFFKWRSVCSPHNAQNIKLLAKQGWILFDIAWHLQDMCESYWDFNLS